MPEFLQPLLWIGAVVAALAAIAGGFLAFRGISKRLEAIGEAVLGKPEVLDFSGAVIEPAVPSIQARVSNLEHMIQNGDQEKRVQALELWRDEHTREGEANMARVLDHVLRQAEGK